MAALCCGRSRAPRLPVAEPPVVFLSVTHSHPQEEQIMSECGPEDERLEAIYDRWV
jgi:hypothetical protein